MTNDSKNTTGVLELLELIEKMWHSYTDIPRYHTFSEKEDLKRKKEQLSRNYF